MRASLLLCLAALASGLFAQGSSYIGPATVLWSPQALVASTIDSAGSGPAATNNAAIIDNDGILCVSPGGDAYGLMDRSTWSTFAGDDDNDGSYTDGVIGNLNAIHLPATAPSPPSLFDFYVSISSDTGPAGIFASGAIQDAEIVRFKPDGTHDKFLTKAQVLDLLCPCVNPNNLDINGFTMDPVSGDLYITFTGAVNLSTGVVDDGGIIRVPSSGFTLDTAGNVATTVTGAAQLVLSEGEVNQMFINAGLNSGATEVDGLQIDPAGGTFTSFAGVTFPNLWMVDDGLNDLAVVSTQGFGTIATVNGVGLQGGTALGVYPTTVAGLIPNASGICFLAKDMTNRPLLIDVSPTAQTTPGAVRIDLAGGDPSAVLQLFLDLTAVVNTPGGAPSRITGLLPPTVGGFEGVYLPLPLSPLPLWSSTVPSDTPLDSKGSTSWTFTVPTALPAVVGVIIQVADSNLRASTPLLVTLQ